ncbi:maleylpyruvate isomerase N-terminal domain-containing protein [Mycobacterium sp. 050134]|uniref:maleylpyruvate isomerase N-terminal domain-containing protein n=1 Tax=Mycobacterium sp. 050134 TaxID=3096111 RepID=UPI002EDB3E8C
MTRRIDDERFPEWRPFLDAARRRRPGDGTWCEAWTVRDIVAHQAGNAEELARVLGAHLAGDSLDTRGFEEREGPLRDLDDAGLWDALLDRMATLNEVAEAAEAAPPDTDVGWTGRTMKVPWFAEHMREELVLHCWDITGDNAQVGELLAQPWMTAHSVFAVGRPLLATGAGLLRPGERVDGRLRVPDADDVVVRADGHDTSIELAPAEGPATIETDAAARVLLLWGRRPSDPSRLYSHAGSDALGLVRRLLSGY